MSFFNWPPDFPIRRWCGCLTTIGTNRFEYLDHRVDDVTIRECLCCRATWDASQEPSIFCDSDDARTYLGVV